MDLDGDIVHEWQADSAPGGDHYLLPDGSLLRSGREDDRPRFRGGGIGGRLQRLAPDGTLLWSWRLADENRHQHHDLEPLPDGNLLLLAWERLSREEAIALGRDPRGVGPQGLWPDMVLEIRPRGADGAEVVWEWHARDHLIQDRDPALPGFGDPASRPGRLDINLGFVPPPEVSEQERRAREELEREMAALGYLGGEEEEPPPADAPLGRWARTGDWMHTNSVDWHPGLDLILLSSPELHEIFVVDHSTTAEEARGSRGGRFGRGGELLWRWGNPANYGHGGPEDRRLFYQHQPLWLEDGGGLRLTVFNNGRGRPGGNRSTVEELVLPFAPERGFLREEGRPFGPERPAWIYEDRDRFYSAFISGAVRLPNGNTLVCSGVPGRIFEVTPEGRVVWDFRNPWGGEVEPPEHAGRAPKLALYRAARYAPDHPGIVALFQALGREVPVP